MIWHKIFLCIAIQGYISWGAEDIFLSIPDGGLRGLLNTTARKNVNYYSFRGIPYAKPPIGNRRFAAPEKNNAWFDTLDATTDGNQCLQYEMDDILGTNPSGDEDCLFINVYTTDYNATDLPVIVWIHGGTFLVGSGNYASYSPDFFLENGPIVFVSLNYRLGIFGFLSTGDAACSGNWGIKDQILALKWVQENIAYFGGNPKNVTIYGESAGAVSVSLLMQAANNQTKGLFKGAIMNSGTTLNLWALNTRANHTAHLVGKHLGIISDSDDYNTTYLIENMRQIDAEKVLNIGWVTASGMFLNNGLRGLPWAPVMEPDIDGAVYVNPSDVALRAGKFNQVNVLMGFNSNEAAAVDDIPFLLRIYLAYYDIAIELLTPYDMTMNETKRFQAGLAIKDHFFQQTAIAASSSKLINFVSADQFERPIRRAATDMSSYTNVYFYVYGYQANVTEISKRNFAGTGHAEDNQVLFKSPNIYTSTDEKVSETMVLLWTNFAKYGNPTPRKDAKLNDTLWNPLDPTSLDFTYMSINSSLLEMVNPKQADWEFYKELWKQYGDIEELTTY